MASKKRNSGFSFRPNMMWLWTIIFIAIIGFALFGQSPDKPKQSDWNQTEQLITRGMVSKIEVVNRDKALVTLTPEAVKELKADKESELATIPEQGHQLEFQIGSVDTFRQDFDKATEGSPVDVKLVYDNNRGGWMDSLLSWLPWVFFIVIWLLLMRGFSRGGGSGAGGGIMNVGKARAQEFDQSDPNRKITFKDVAGLE